MTYAPTPKAGVSGARPGAAAQCVTPSPTPPAVPANRVAGGGFSGAAWTPLAIAASVPDRPGWSYPGAELLRLVREARAEIEAAERYGRISEDVDKYETSPGGNRGLSVTETRQSGVHINRALETPVYRASDAEARGASMPSMYHRHRYAGERHRARLRELLLHRLYVGALLPRHACLGVWLGISASEAGRHLTRVLDEAGVVRRVCGKPRRVRVVAVPEWRAAA